MRQRAEAARVERMLDEPEFSQAISAIEALALWLVRRVAWFIDCLFGVTAEHVENDVHIATAEPFAPRPSS